MTHTDGTKEREEAQEGEMAGRQSGCVARWPQGNFSTYQRGEGLDVEALLEVLFRGAVDAAEIHRAFSLRE